MRLLFTEQNDNVKTVKTGNWAPLYMYRLKAGKTTNGHSKR
jgi:hypothetical protein